MIGLDTNVIIRYLTRDDEPQYRATMKLLCRKGASFFVCDLVLVEADWVLSRFYEWTRDEVADAFARLLQVHNLQFQDEDRIRHSLAALRRGVDLSDELLVAACREQECHEFATFDVAVTKRHPKFAVVPRE
jgi:predicted nucleic-acid-binding protein